MAKKNPKEAAGSTKPATLSVMPASAILAIGSVFSLGAEKYGRFDWRRSGVKPSTYLDSAMRHLLAFTDGEDVDAESCELHLANAAADLMIVIDCYARRLMKDDRDVHESTKGTAAALISQHVRMKTNPGGFITVEPAAPAAGYAPTGALAPR